MMKRKCYFCGNKSKKKEMEVITVPMMVDIFLTIPAKAYAHTPCIEKNIKWEVKSPGALKTKCIEESFGHYTEPEGIVEE